MTRQTLAWISQHRTIWRVAVLVLLLAAIIGPWIYSSDGAPPAEACRAPNVLLENERCVRLVSGANAMAYMVSAFFSISAALVTGAAAWADRGREYLGVFLFVVGVWLLVQPFLSTLLLILGGERRSRRIFHLSAWGLAGGLAGLLMVASCAPRQCAGLWGMWLYVGLAASALALELLMLVARRSSGQEKSSPKADGGPITCRPEDA